MKETIKRIKIVIARASMSREDFRDRAIRQAERDINVPRYWWGSYREVFGVSDNGHSIRVWFTRANGGSWIVAVGGPTHHDRNGMRREWAVSSRHDTRTRAINKGRRL